VHGKISPQREQDIRESFDRQGLMTSLGAQVDEVTKGRVVLSMPHSNRITQQHGFFHGGAVGALADSACGYAALSMAGEGEAGLTAEYKINLLSPADGEKLIAVGEVIKAGRTLIVAQGDVFVEKGGTRKRCATMLMTLCVVKTLGNI
jgi:uncharacterized protein (TIGR00369 family)